VESLGERLKRERERQKMTLDDVATATKIGTRMLKALEDDHFDQLPGGIFNKGFVRAYARHLGMDEEQAIADYLAATGPAQTITIKEPEAVLSALAVRAEQSRLAEKPGGDDLPWDKLAAVLLLVAFGFALWGWRTRKPNHDETKQQSNPPVAPSSPAPAAPAPTLSASQPLASNGEQPAMPGSATSTPAASPTQDQPAALAATGPFFLVIQAHKDSWIEVAADGKEMVHELLPAGAEKSIQAQHEIVVKVGNVGGLDFTFNGKKLPSQGASDQVKTLKFDSTGLQSPLAGVHFPENSSLARHGD
jgi:cytoskeleton protein RodZ